MKETISKIKPPSRMYIPLELYAVEGFHKRYDPADEEYIHRDVVVEILKVLARSPPVPTISKTGRSCTSLTL